MREICGGQPVRILIPRAAAGNPDLVRELEQAGDVEIRDLAIYETKYRTSGIIDVRDEVLRGEIDFAVFTSASTVRGFCAMMKGAENDPAVPDLSGVRAVCIGRQTKAAADAAGMRTWMARRAAIDDLVDAVVRACDPDNPF
jgi:uroporphyrinogen III methyltransferase/synthase